MPIKRTSKKDQVILNDLIGHLASALVLANQQHIGTATELSYLSVNNCVQQDLQAELVEAVETFKRLSTYSVKRCGELVPPPSVK